MAKNKKKKENKTDMIPISSKFTLNKQSNKTKKTTSKEEKKKILENNIKFEKDMINNNKFYDNKEQNMSYGSNHYKQALESDKKELNKLNKSIKKDKKTTKTVDKNIAPVSLQQDDRFTIKTPEVVKTKEQEEAYQKRKSQAALQGKYVGKKAISGVTNAVSGLADAPLQTLQEGAEQGKNSSTAKNIIRGYVKSIDRYGFTNIPENARELSKIASDPNLTTSQKIVQTGLAAFNDNPVVQMIEGAGRLYKGIDKKADKKLKKARETVEKPADKVSEWAEKDRDKVGKTAQEIGDAAQVTTNMIPSIAASIITQNPNIGLATMGISAKGQATREAESQGMPLSKSNDKGFAIGAVEVATEKMFSGFGKVLGKGALDDVAKEGLNKIIKNKGLNYVAKKGLDILGEWAEETVSDLVDTYLDKNTTNPDAKYSWKQWFETGKMTALSTIFLNFLTGGYMPNSYIENSTELEKSNQTKNVQKIIESELKDRMQTEYKGKATAKEIAKLQKEIIEDIQKGYISTDTIEKTLGGETYNQLDKINQERQGIQTQIDELQQKADNNELSSLEEKQKLNDLKEQIKTIDDSEIRNRLNQVIQETIKNDSGLQESYKEVGRRTENYIVDLDSIQDEKQKEVYQKAMDSGVLNNSNKTHALVDMIAKISSDKNIDFDFTNNEQLEKSGFGVNGRNINGYVTDSGITINLNSSKAINRIVGHELTHTFEGTKLYTELQDSLKDFLGNEWAKQVAKYEELYKGVKNANVENELTSDLIGDYLFTDESFVRSLSTEHKNLFEKIYDEIKYLYNVATAGSKEKRQLEKVKRTFDRIYNETSSVVESKDAKYSITGIEGAKQLAKTDSNYQYVVDNYNTALELKKNNKKLTNEDIRQITGWFQDKYNTWKYEVSDDLEAAYLKETPEKNGSYNSLRDIFEHNILYKMYPGLEDIKLKFDDINAKGKYSKENNTIYINNDLINSYSDTIGTLLHEIQHYIQHNEPRFVSGTSASKGILRYLRRLGEIEAADTKNRRELTESERKAIAPETSKKNPVHPEREEILDLGASKLEKTIEPLYNKVNDMYEKLILAGEKVENFVNKNSGQDNSEIGKENENEDLGERRYRGVGNTSFSLSKDSQGRELSEEVIEKTQYSKIRDEEGRLEPFYHGSNKNIDIFDSTRKPFYNNQNVNYFTSSENIGKTYGSNVQEVYINSINPYIFDGNTDGYSLEYSNTAKEEYRNNKEIIDSIRNKLDENGGRYYKKSVAKNCDAILENKGNILSNEEINFLIEHPYTLASLSIKGKNGFVAYGNSVMTNDVVNAVLSINNKIDNKYDSVLFKSIKDSGQYYDENTLKEKSDVIATFDANQIVRDNDDIRYSLSQDSQGNELSKQQQDYFKYSQARDENGNLEVVYHGSNKAGFTTFDSKYNFYTNSKDVSQTYTHSSEMVDTRKLESVFDAKSWLKSISSDFYIENNKVYDEGIELLSYTSTEDMLKNLKRDIQKEVGNVNAGGIYEGYVNIENPLVVNCNGGKWSAIDINGITDNLDDFFNEYGLDTFEEDGADRTSTVDITKLVAEAVKDDVLDYDGIIFKDIIDEGTYYNGGKNNTVSNVYVTFNSNQFKAKDNLDPTKNRDIRYSLSQDSQGRELSEGQQEYFKDSKVRDDEGRLLEVYHGSYEKGFTIFDKNMRGSATNAKSSKYGFFFTDNYNLAKDYSQRSASGQLFKSYLNMTNPLVKDFEGKQVNADAELTKMLKEAQNNGNDGIIAYNLKDGFRTDNQYVVFNSNQIKNVDNLNPTENEDIRYSLDIAPISKNFLTESEQKELDGLRAVDNSGFAELTPEEQSRMYELENRANTVLDKKAEKMLRSASYKAINTSTKVAENYLDFDANQKKSFRNQMREFSNMTKDELVGADTYNKVKDIVSQYANREYTYFDDSVEGIKRELKHTKIRVTDEMKNQITDYGYFVRDSKLMLRRNSGTPVDQVYQEYSEMYPNFFDSEVWSEADQLERLNDFMNHDFSVTEKYKLTDEDLRVATDLIYNKLLDNSLSQQDLIETEEILDKKVQKRTRTVVREELLNKMGITPELIGEGNDISAIDFARTDPVRVNEKVFGWKTGQLINDATVNFTKHQEAERMRFLNKERQEIKDLGIKARSKESELVQKYGEKQYVDKNNEVHPYTDAELNRDVKDAATREKIKNAARVLRQKYDTYIDRVNSVLTEMGYDEIPKRQDYMRHFVELDDKFSRWGLPFNKESMMAEDLPTDINGLTEFNRPGKSYFASANTRTGLQTTYDAITGIDGYLEGVSNLIYHTESIQRYRALTRFIRENYGREHGLDNIDLMTDEELAERIKDIQDNKLSKYVAWLDEQANSIAGKKGSLDRSVERMFGRRIYTALNTLKSQVGSNMTGFNVRSAMTNFASAIQGASKTKKLALVKGTISTINNIINNDGLIDKSDFLTRRFGSDSLAMKPWQKLSKAGQVFMEGTDYFTANQIWRSKYFENLDKGMSETQAIKNADDFAARIMGDRSKGSTAELFNSKTLGFLSQFQLEVNNQWSSLIHDNKIDIQKGDKTALGVTFELGQLFAASYMFNTMMKALTGSDVMIDPIDMLLKIFKPDDDDKDEGIVKRAQKVLGEFINQLPFANLVTGGGRIPISEAFTGVKTLGTKLMGGTDNYGNEISWGDVGDDLKESLAYWILPTGYGQIRKTVKGLSMYDDKLPIAGSYTDSGNLRFSAEDTTFGKVKAALFGQYSSKYAQDYIDSGYKSINASKLDEMKDLDMNSTEYRDYREGLSAAGTSIEDKLNYISDLDVSDEDKTIMASNVAKKDIDMAEYKKFGSYDEFNYAQKNPTKYEVMKLVGGYDTYKNYEKAISEITTDYDRNGKAITNSRKNKVIKYVNSLNLTRAQKAMLIKEQYPSFTQYDSQIASYVNNQNMSFIQKAGILKQLGFKAYDRQIINYIRENYRTVEEQQEELEKLGFKIYNYNGKTYVR